MGKAGLQFRGLRIQTYGLGALQSDVRCQVSVGQFLNQDNGVLAAACPGLSHGASTGLRIRLRGKSSREVS